MPQPFARLLLGAEWISTLAMFGIIWFVQIVHYPMFLEVAPGNFTRYETAYANRMGFLVGPLMVLDLSSAALLVAPALRPAAISATQAWAGLLLLGLIWASTAFVQIPLHNQLHLSPDRAAMHRLIGTNWIRTVAWSARAVLMLFWIDRLGRRP